MNLISIIIPAYNAEKTIKKAAQSVLDQIDVNLELIIVDDGSNDRTKELCEEIREEDNRVKVFRINNHGVAYARNYGISQSTGEFIGFVDSDDWVEPHMYSVLFNLIKTKKLHLSICNFSNELNGRAVQSNNDGKQSGVIQGTEMYGQVYYSKNIGGYLCNKLFEKKYIKTRIDEKYAQCEDYIFVLNYLKGIDGFAYTNEKLYHYNRRNSFDDFGYNARSLTLIPAYEDVLKIYSEFAPVYMPAIRTHVLKTYLNFYARFKIICDDNTELKKKIQSGIKTYFSIVMKDSQVSFKEKLNIFLTYVFPKSSLRIKKVVLYCRRNKGKW